MGCTCSEMEEVRGKIRQLHIARAESALFEIPYTQTNSSLTEMKDGIIKTASSDVVSEELECMGGMNAPMRAVKHDIIGKINEKLGELSKELAELKAEDDEYDHSKDK